MSPEADIPESVAMELCHEVHHGRPRLFSQCWGCLRFSRGDPRRMCFHDPPANRGCSIVNRSFDKLSMRNRGEGGGPA